MIRYRLDELGAIQFEWLCQSLLKKVCGLAVESWGGHSDRGNDAHSQVPVTIAKPKTQLPGPVTFQAKFVSGANAAGGKPLAAVKKAVLAEIGNLKARQPKLLLSPGSYVLLTNAPLSAKGRQDITELFRKVFPKRKVLIINGVDLCSMLDDASGIRLSFPQLLGLGDLNALIESVVDRRIINRSKIVKSRAEDLATVFFPTTAYNQALAKLEKHGFVVLTGPPEMGKTTIARMIGLAKMSEKWRCLECMEPGEVITHIKDASLPTLFIADDAFGTTEYKPDKAFEWAQELDSILRSVDKRHWLIWTSRPAPLKLALEKMHLQGRAESFPSPGEIVVDAAELSRLEKTMILFRHAKNAGMSEEAKTLLRSHAEEIIDNKHFTPERVRRFILDVLPGVTGQNKSQISSAIKMEIERPTQAMSKSFKALDPAHQAILIAMLDAGSGLTMKKSLSEAVKRLGYEDVNIDQTLTNLESHFIRQRQI